MNRAREPTFARLARGRNVRAPKSSRIFRPRDGQSSLEIAPFQCQIMPSTVVIFGIPRGRSAILAKADLRHQEARAAFVNAGGETLLGVDG